MEKPFSVSQIIANKTIEHCDLQVFLHILYRLVVTTLRNR